MTTSFKKEQSIAYIYILNISYYAFLIILELFIMPYLLGV